MSESKRYKVLCPVTNRDGKTFWKLLGIAFPNHDGSTNVYLDGLPLNGKLQIREWDDVPTHRRDGADGARGDKPNESLPF
jgi:hypothetical protein